MRNHTTQKLLQRHNPEKIIESLAPYLTDQRKARIESVLERRLESITLAIEQPADINNALAAVRTCEALGIATVHIISPQHNVRYINGITKSAFYWVDIRLYKTFEEFLGVMKSENRKIGGAILNAKKTVSEISLEKPVCLLLGNEMRGLTDIAKKSCDFFYSIPMCGMSESLNLSVAAAISLYDVSQRKRLQLNNQTDLSGNTANKLRAQYYLHSVDARLAVNILK